MSKGFTIIELMVAVAIFVVLTIGAANFLFSATISQRDSITMQEVLTESSSVAEYMGRALRGAKKELNSGPQNCLTTVGRGYNYELNGTNDRVRFLSRENLCQEFYLSGTEILERKSTNNTAQSFGEAVELTSSDILVQELRFSVTGQNQTDSLQPRASFFFKMQSVGEKAEAQNRVQVQTTISQRNFDIEK
ncbi:MAG: prepilin-type N-terminal cleavage/methylation domain-containing protein [bacterium]|nr:prepilin-type N-terminal cleavage/methylation domain-containing protein [bacterium]